MRVEVMTVSITKYSTDEEKEYQARRLSEFCKCAEKVETLTTRTEHHTDMTVFAFFKE